MKWVAMRWVGDEVGGDEVGRDEVGEPRFYYIFLTIIIQKFTIFNRFLLFLLDFLIF
jgi:hypothetical protein